MGSTYEKYNQALSKEKQLNQIEESLKPQIQEQLSRVESSENSYNKNLRKAVLQNENVDLRSASRQKQQFQNVKQELQQPLSQINQERKKINQQKSSVATIESLEAKGYKKEIRGGKIIFYKEDTYSRSKDDKRTYREEEYIFNSDGTPVEFIRRDDYREGDKRKVDEEEVVRFDSKGRVSQVRTYDDGEKKETKTFDFNSDGSISVEERDHEKERELNSSVDDGSVEVSASLYRDGSSSYSTTKNGVTTTTTYERKRTPTKKIESTKTLQATKTPTIETSMMQSLDLSVSEEQQLVQTQTATPQQIQRQQETQSSFITDREVTFSFTETKEGEVNLNPARFFVAPFQLGSSIGGYIADNVQGRASVVQDVRSGFNSVKEQGVIQTTKNIVAGTINHVSTDPFGFVGEGAALGGAGKGVKQSVQRSTTKVNPIEVNSRSVSIDSNSNNLGVGVERVQLEGSAEVTQGVFNKKTSIVEFEGEATINKQTRALGGTDPDVGVVRENSLSREISPANVYDGELKLRTQDGSTSSTNIDGFSQGNKQITNVGKETFVSETQKVASLDNNDLFMTQTQNVKTGDFSVTTSQNVKSQGTTSPTQDAFASASESQTDVFFNQKDILSSQEKIFDTTAKSSSSRKDTLALTQQTSDEIKIVNIEELNANRKSNSQSPSSSNQRDFVQGGQTQVFEQKAAQKQSSTEVASFENNFLDDSKDLFKTESRTTNVPVSRTMIKDLVSPKSKSKPIVNARTQDAFSQNDLFSGQNSLSGTSSTQTPARESSFETDVSISQTPARTNQFRQQSSQRTINDPMMNNPQVSTFTSNVKPPVRPKLDVDLNDNFSLKDPLSNNKKSKKNQGQFAGSLTALNQGIFVDDVDPNKKTSGLSKRAILRGRGF